VERSAAGALNTFIILPGARRSKSFARTTSVHAVALVVGGYGDVFGRYIRDVRERRNRGTVNTRTIRANYRFELSDVRRVG